MTDAAVGTVVISSKGASRGIVRTTLRAMFRDPMAVVGVVFVVLFVLVAIVGHISAPDPQLQTAALGKSPSSAHWFGTDGLGRDLFARCAAGALVSLQVAIGSVALGLLIAVPIGMLAGYFATTWLDEAIMRVVDVILSLPLFILGLVVLGFLGSGPMHVLGFELPPVTKVIGLIALAGVPMFARVARASVLIERQEDYVDALRVIGVGRMRILFGDVFVNIIPAIVVQATTWMAVAIFSEAGLSFLGLGIQPPSPTLGNILLESQSSILLGRWWLAVFPGLLIFAVIVGFNLVGDGIGHAFGRDAGT
jgi:ABC-type dipeptide/oligopeptide/nickel transport system permease subunit